MSRKIVVAVMVINLVLSAVAQAHLAPLSQRPRPRQMNDPNLVTTSRLPAYRVGPHDLISEDILIVASRRRRQRFRREVRREFRHQDRRRERRNAEIGGAIIGGLITGAIVADQRRRERRREVIEHHHQRHHPHRHYGY